MRLIRCIVKLLDVDVRRNAAPDGLVFVGRHGAAQRQHEAQARFVRRMLVRAVDCGRRLSEREHREIPKVRLRKVRIKCQQLTVCNGLRCAAAALEHPADKPADILDAALLRLG